MPSFEYSFLFKYIKPLDPYNHWEEIIEGYIHGLGRFRAGIAKRPTLDPIHGDRDEPVSCTR